MRPVFISGCGRSGTTLLGAMLGTHSRCLATPESKFILQIYRTNLKEHREADLEISLEKIKNHWSFKVWGVELNSKEEFQPNLWNSYSDLVLWLVKMYGSEVGKTEVDIWVDHTPNARSFSALLFDLFPDGKMVHIVRDGRAVASSVMGLDWGPNTINSAAHWWIENIANGLAIESYFGDSRVQRIRYEDLILEPQATLEKICDFIEIDFESEMISASGFQLPQYTANQHTLVGGKLDVGRLRAWEKELTSRQVEIFENLAGNLLRCLEYELIYGPGAKETNNWEKVSLQLREAYYRFFINKFHRQRRIRRAISGQENGKDNLMPSKRQLKDETAY